VTTLHEAFEAWARSTPSAVAVVDGAGSLTYRELDHAAARVAAAVRAAGVEPGTLVGISLPRSTRVVAAILGVLKAGCAYVPLDPEYPRSRLSFLASDAGIDLVIGDSDPRLDLDLRWLPFAEAIEAGGGSPSPAGGSGELAYVIYTSGSTGTPKGVCISHANVLALFAAAAPLFRFGSDDVWALFHSYSFDFSVWELWGALLHGGRAVVVPAEVTADPVALLELLAAQGVTVLNQVPSVFRYLAAAHASRPLPLELRYLIFGGEALDARAAASWTEAAPPPGPALVNMYGITETTVHVTHKALAARDLAEADAPTPIGRPLPHLEVVLLDDDLRPVEPGEVGEIFVAGAGLARGYLNRPDLTDERFLRLGPTGPRYYRSGDLARVRDDGELEYHGRKDAQVKILGFRVEVGEVEAVLRRHEGIADAVVVPGTSPRGEANLVAFYVSGESADPSPASLRRYLQEALPRYMVPARFERVERLPLTPSGKVDRRSLSQR
jgi:amino acid adenylation domain-containing protein